MIFQKKMFTLISHFQKEREVVFATLDPTFRELKIALKLLNYSQMKFFMCARETYRPVLYEVVEEEKLSVIFDDGTVMKYLKNEEANKLEIE